MIYRFRRAELRWPDNTTFRPSHDRTREFPPASEGMALSDAQDSSTAANLKLQRGVFGMLTANRNGGGVRLAQDFAEVDKVGLRGGALRERDGLPVFDKLSKARAAWALLFVAQFSQSAPGLGSAKWDAPYAIAGRAPSLRAFRAHQRPVYGSQRRPLWTNRDARTSARFSRKTLILGKQKFHCITV